MNNTYLVKCWLWTGTLLIILFTGCFKNDEALPPYTSSGTQYENVAEVGKDYGNQLWFDLETNTFVKSAPRELWDLAFDSRPGKYGIWLNSSKKMRLAHLGHSDWNLIPTDPLTAGLDWQYDESTGSADSTAFGQISGHSSVPSGICVLDLGLKTTGSPLGFASFQLLEASPTKYVVAYRVNSQDKTDTIEILRQENYNFVHLSFYGIPHTLLAEPPASSWDLLFTQYTTRVFYTASTTDFEWYSVNGVLLNAQDTFGTKDTISTFENIDYETISQYSYSKIWDVIGYKWKSYDSNLGAYIIFYHHNYIIKTSEGNYFKLRFVSFVNDQGERGFPRFQFSKI